MRSYSKFSPYLNTSWRLWHLQVQFAAMFAFLSGAALCPLVCKGFLGYWLHTCNEYVHQLQGEVTQLGVSDSTEGSVLETGSSGFPISNGLWDELRENKLYLVNSVAFDEQERMLDYGLV
jgi:hypothetical protein